MNETRDEKQHPDSGSTSLDEKLPELFRLIRMTTGCNVERTRWNPIPNGPLDSLLPPVGLACCYFFVVASSPAVMERNR